MPTELHCGFQALYAATIGPKSLKQMELYTGIPFSSMGLDKLDLIAIPDFAAGAMENWGLITFRWVPSAQQRSRRAARELGVNAHMGPCLT